MPGCTPDSHRVQLQGAGLDTCILFIPRPPHIPLPQAPAISQPNARCPTGDQMHCRPLLSLRSSGACGVRGRSAMMHRVPGAAHSSEPRPVRFLYCEVELRPGDAPTFLLGPFIIEQVRHLLCAAYCVLDTVHRVQRMQLCLRRCLVLCKDLFICLFER